MNKDNNIINDPRTQSNSEIINSLLTNTRKQYTEAAHAAIFSRLISTINHFNHKAETVEKIMLILASTQVLLAVTQILLALH